MKTLLLGASLSGVSCADWMGTSLPNLADFDLVVVNSLSLESLLRPGEDKKELSSGQFTEWSTRLNLVRERATKLLKSGGRLVAIMGSGTIRVTKLDPNRELFPKFIQSSDWLPLPIEFCRESGETVITAPGELTRYMGHVKQWRYHVRIDARDSGRLEDLSDEHEGNHVEVQLEPVAVNRQKLPIAARAYYEVHESSGGGWKALANTRSGDLVILPPPTQCSVEEGLRVLLEDIAGLHPTTPVPEWVSHVPPYGAKSLLDRIERLEVRASRLDEKLTSLHEEYARREAFRALLYETGIAALQDVVEAGFWELGLKTEPSEVSDEFVVDRRGRKLLIEVKGNDKSAKLTDLRQLIDYQLEHEQKHDKPIKSALVVNAWRLVPADDRGKSETPIFPDNVIKRAKDNNIALLDTRELYEALNRYWLGEVKGGDVFESLFKGAGVVRLVMS